MKRASLITAYIIRLYRKYAWRKRRESGERGRGAHYNFLLRKTSWKRYLPPTNWFPISSSLSAVFIGRSELQRFGNKNCRSYKRGKKDKDKYPPNLALSQVRKKKEKKVVLLPFCSHESQKIKYGQRNGEGDEHLIKTG